MDFSITADQRLMQESLARTLETAAPLDRVRAFAADREPIARDVWAALADFGLPGVVIPEEHGGLGLGRADLDRHIAWDIGAAAVTRRLAALLDAPALLGTYSRLLIDLNRPPDCEGSIVAWSEGTPIAANCASRAHSPSL